MQPIDKSTLGFFPKEFHARIIRDDLGKYWISCQRRSELNSGNDLFYALDPFLVLERYSITRDGTIIYED
jgi:hypothetical protein